MRAFDVVLILLLTAIVAGLMMVRYLKRQCGLTAVTRGNRKYIVRKSENKEQVADFLASLEGKVNAFVAAIAASHAGDGRVARVVERWTGRLAETSPWYDGEAAYTTDKRAISISVRDSNGGMQDQNIAMYVLLHELAHVANPQHGHDEEFWETFHFFLGFAVKAGMYTPVKTATSYCGFTIDVS